MPLRLPRTISADAFSLILVKPHYCNVILRNPHGLAYRFSARDGRTIVSQPCALTQPLCSIRNFHATRRLLTSNVEGKNHYERLRVAPDASPTEIKKAFYALSKTHHPDANRSDPNAAHTFALLAEAYTTLSNPSRRAAYDRDVLRLHHHHHHHQNPHHGSYHSTSQAGGRSPTGLSRRRGTFRGPPPSFYRSGGWGTHGEKRRQAHEETTGSAGSPSGEKTGTGTGPSGGEGDRANPWASGAFTHRGQYGGMGPGSDPYGHRDDEVPYFDKAGHTRTHQRQDERRWRREKRAMGDDGIEFEPQTSLAGHFLIVAGILAATFLAPAIYLQFMRLGRQKKDKDS